MNTQEVELLAMKLWQEETGQTYGWGSVFETYEYRRRAREILGKKSENQ